MMVEEGVARRRVPIVWDADTEAVVRPVIEEVLEHHLWIVPTWCHRIYVGYDDRPADGGLALFVETNPEYRWARITVCPGVLKCPAWEKEQHVVHELFHLPLEPLHVLAADLRNLAADRAPAAFLNEQWRRAWEGAVCDLTAAHLAVHSLYGHDRFSLTAAPIVVLDEPARERLREAIGCTLALVPGLEARDDFGPLVDATAGAALGALYPHTISARP
jgi:hypothetical protein